MDPPEAQTRPGNLGSSPSSTSTLAKPKSKPTKLVILLVIASAAIALGLLFVCYSILRAGNNRGVSLRHSIIIDGGSSGTRVHVFGYRIKSGKPVFDFREENYSSLKLSPGLSAYADNPEGVSVSVTELEFSKKRVPKEMLKKSDIRLMATAGMRLLKLPVQEQILEVTRRVLRSSGFMFRDEWASVISGSDEGVYAWLVANHALGSLGGEPLQTTGIVELGGASAQVTFVSSELVPHEFSHKVSYGNVSYNLYSHSFLHYGQDAAQEKLLESLHSSAANFTGEGVVTDPCIPKGYIPDKYSQNESSGFLAEESRFRASLQAAGNFPKCRSAAFELLKEGKAGKRFCGEEWSKLEVKYPTIKKENLLRYCFSSAYIVSMLHDSLGVALDNERIGFADKAGEDVPLDWALGAFILNTATSTSDYSGRSTKNVIGISAEFSVSNHTVANSTEDVIVADPCTPKGYIYDKNSEENVSGFLTDESKFKGSLQAAGNFSNCRSATYALLQQGTENCPYTHCSIGSTFTLDLRGSFLATSNFFYTSKFFGLEEKGWLSELIPAGKKYCAEEWSKIKLDYPKEKEEYWRGYCFSSAYIISMLHDSLGNALDDERVTYASKAGPKDIPLDWALGALILDAVKPISGYSATSRKFLGF